MVVTSRKVSLIYQFVSIAFVLYARVYKRLSNYIRHSDKTLHDRLYALLPVRNMFCIARCIYVSSSMLFLNAQKNR